VGYAVWDEPRGWSPPDGFEQFLSSGDPPVLITTSSAGERDNSRMFRAALEALRQTGRRGVLLVGGNTPPPPSDLAGTPDVVAWTYVPLSRIVPRCSLVVHHAGIGTALTTLRHGVPAVAIPATFDQWYNADRVKALGVGRTIKWNDLTPQRLAADIDEVLADSGYSARAKDLGRRMDGEDGARTAADEIEGFTSAAAT
jgi:MGT family glycosyltransferase